MARLTDTLNIGFEYFDDINIYKFVRVPAFITVNTKGEVCTYCCYSCVSADIIK